MLNTQKNLDGELSPIIIKLLEKRGITPSDFAEFFSWDLNTLPDLCEMHDMDVASERIIQALDENQKIGIFGDYDVDGTTSCALFYQFFKMLGTEVELFQPSRFVEGYGIHPSSIEDAIAKGVDVLITVDCGISNLETAEYAKERNLDLIITDHHKDAREHLPAAYAVVNPNRRDEPENSPLRVLAGVGVAFAVCVAVRKKLAAMGHEVPTLYPLLQYVAIGTISDLAKLENVNLKLVRHGLKQIPQTQYPGIRVFLGQDEQNLKVLPSEKIAFGMGPYINSKGRLDHPEIALRQIIATEHREAFNYFSQLEISNRQRKQIQAQVFEEARDQILKNMHTHPGLIQIVYASHWHEGVIGIVASKIVETFKVPAIVFCDSEHEGVIKASARSAGELNLFDCLSECKDLFIKFGGHKAAAGLSMRKENLPELKHRFDEMLGVIPEISRTVIDSYDLEIHFNQIDRKLIQELDQMEPFGMGNERPVFKMRDIVISNYTILKDVHVKWTFHHKNNPNVKLGGISFNYIGKWNALHPEDIFARQDKEDLSIVFQLGLNRFRGNEIIQLMVSELKLGS